jgi:methylmalonyl-CoA mutase cobalamin-binding domain/chain
MENTKKTRILLTRDDFHHQRGYWVLAKAMSNFSFEVVLGGIQTPREIVQAAIQENVDIIGYRIMNGAPNILISKLYSIMTENGIPEVPVVVGGIVSSKDERLLKEMGVRHVFHPHTNLGRILDSLSNLSASKN